MLDSIKKNFFLPIRQYPFFFDLLKRASRALGNKSEEYELLNEYGLEKKECVILQVGANDGISNDPVREFLVKHRKWCGVLIEPIPHLFTKLRANYKGYSNVSFFQCAVSDHSGHAIIYSYKKAELGNLPFYADQIASFDRSHLIRHFPDLKNQDLLIEELTVPVYTIEDFAGRNSIPNIDVLIIDVEGYETKLLQDFPFRSLKPDIVIFETLHMVESDMVVLSKLLHGNHYLLHTNTFDTIAIKKDLPVPNWIAKYRPA